MLQGKSLLQRLIDKGAVSKIDIADYYNSEVKPFLEGPKYSRYSYNEYGTIGLFKFDTRDLTESGEAIIVDYCTSIENEAFAGCPHIKKIVLPRRVIKIGKDAFRNCENLETIVIPTQLNLIEDNAFNGCKNLVNISTPQGCVEIGKDAFFNTPVENEFIQRVDENRKALNRMSGVCSPIYSWVVNGELVKFDERDLDELGEFKIPHGVKVIGSYVFSECRKITSVVLPTSLDKIKSFAFYLCRNLQNVEMPNTVTELEDYAFAACWALKEIKLSSNIKVLPMGVFAGCEKLEKVELPLNLKAIEERAFRYCNKIKEINVPSELQRVAWGAFDDAPSSHNLFLNTVKNNGDQYQFNQINNQIRGFVKEYIEEK